MLSWGLSPFSKNLIILNPSIFSENLTFHDQEKLAQQAGQISEKFPQNIMIKTLFENLEVFRNLRILSNFENCFVDRIEPWSNFEIQ